jgi:ferric-dicitrate binding protein FerR (iron transport regulator)
MWRELLQLGRPRVESAAEFLNETKMPSGRRSRSRSRAGRKKRARRFWLAGGGVAAALLALWVFWQRPLEPYPPLSSTVLVRFATGQGLACQPPDNQPAAVHWSCHSVDGASRNLEWFETSNKVRAIDATFGPPASSMEAATWLGSVASLPIPSDRQQEVRKWVRDHPGGGQTAWGPVNLGLGSSGQTYSLTVDVG